MGNINDLAQYHKANVWDLRSYFEKSPLKGGPLTKHDEHAAPFPLILPRIIIEGTTEEWDVVYDPFNGTGSVAIEACRRHRIGIGSDINPRYIEMSKKRAAKILKTKSITSFTGSGETLEPILFTHDAREAPDLPSKVSCIITSPPYWDVKNYSKLDNARVQYNDIGKKQPLDAYKGDMLKCWLAWKGVVKHGGYVYMLIGDVTKDGNRFPLHCMHIELGEHVGFKLRSIKIALLHSLVFFNYVLIFQK